MNTKLDASSQSCLVEHGFWSTVYGRKADAQNHTFPLPLPFHIPFLPFLSFPFISISSASPRHLHWEADQWKKILEIRHPTFFRFLPQFNSSSLIRLPNNTSRPGLSRGSLPVIYLHPTYTSRFLSQNLLRTLNSEFLSAFYQTFTYLYSRYSWRGRTWNEHLRRILSGAAPMHTPCSQTGNAWLMANYHRPAWNILTATTSQKLTWQNDTHRHSRVEREPRQKVRTCSFTLPSNVPWNTPFYLWSAVLTVANWPTVVFGDVVPCSLVGGIGGTYRPHFQGWRTNRNVGYHMQGFYMTSQTRRRQPSPGSTCRLAIPLCPWVRVRAFCCNNAGRDPWPMLQQFDPRSSQKCHEGCDRQKNVDFVHAKAKWDLKRHSVVYLIKINNKFQTAKNTLQRTNWGPSFHSYLFTYGLFCDTVNSSAYTTWNGRMINEQ
jgi:hypothetical protein